MRRGGGSGEEKKTRARKAYWYGGGRYERLSRDEKQNKSRNKWSHIQALQRSIAENSSASVRSYLGLLRRALSWVLWY